MTDKKYSLSIERESRSTELVQALRLGGGREKGRIEIERLSSLPPASASCAPPKGSRSTPFQRKARKPILVIGDAMIDEWVECVEPKVSAEEPCLVGKVKEYKVQPGGAANVALGLAALGEDVELRFGVGEHPACKVPLKTRVRIDGRQVVRFDCNDLVQPITTGGKARYKAIVICDYGKGSIAGASNIEVPAYVHTKNSPFWFIGDGDRVFFCNHKEQSAYLKFYNAIEKRNPVVVTLGKIGARYNYDGDKPLNARTPSMALEGRVRNVCGAGDSFMAGFIVAHLQGLPPKRCLDYASLVAAVAVMHDRTYAPLAEEVIDLAEELGVLGIVEGV